MTDSPIDEREIRYLGDVLRLELRPNDILVLKVHQSLSDRELIVMRQNLESIFPGRQIVILDNDVELGVLTPKDE